ncbi:MAG TPA: HlyD family efflux transporter periplasmic adaptor subunit [Anaerolineae bacterium]|nr:HlyD family efflux transporter periplasmic adaptor subunit [Anaerolineae bacterium]
MKKKRTWIVLGIGLIVVVIAGLIASNNQNGTAQAAQAGVQFGRVTRATLLQTIDSSGSASPESEVTLSFGTTGTVAKVNVQPGVRVKQGEVLAELDTRDLELQLAQQQQAYIGAQASYSMTLTPDPNEVAAAKTALSNATAAYQLAQQKYSVNSTDQVMVSCNNLDNVQKTYNDAVTAYNNYLSNWRVQVNGAAEISPQKAQLDRAKAAYEQAVANCSLAKSGVNNSGVQSALSQVEQAKVNLDQLLNPPERTLAQARLKLDQARLSLEQAQRQLAKAKISAPFAGTVTQVTAVVGGPGGSVTIALADDSRYHVEMLVDETEIVQIKLGQKAEVTFDALPEAKVTGTVSRIDPAGTISQGVVNYKVRINLEPTTAPLRLDMTANGRIILDTHANVLAVPGAAIRSDPQGGYYVNVVDQSGEAKRVEVTTGYTDGDLTEVSGELQPNERVYLSEPPARQQQGFSLFGLRLGGR